MSFNHNEKIGQSQSDGVIQGYKHRGETLSIFLNRIRQEYDIAETIPMTYAGRLDPMAEGAMIVLIGEKCKEKDQYLGLDKTYDFEVLLGVSTDTYDVLGCITSVSVPTSIQKESIERGLSSIAEKTSWVYPPYSSRTVNGKPLFMYAREGILPEDMPQKEGIIKNILLRDILEVSTKEIVASVIKDIELVDGDFRQKESIEQWTRFAQTHPQQRLQLLVCTATVTSGVYIRTIAHELGRTLHSPSLAYRIVRTNIDYKK